MGSVSFDGKTYIIDGEKLIVYGGTLQYFRVPAESWRDRLEKMKNAGLNTVDTYVPWNWHEPEEEHFDFNGETHPQRNLEEFFELAEDLGLYIIIRPGPYICGEWKNGGIPQWLIDKHPEILAKSPKGLLPDDIYYPPITYLHPTYLDYVMKWYNKVLPIIKKHLYTKRGNIISVTIDDEPSYWETIFQPFLTDYNEIITKEGGIWQMWLEMNYSLEELRKRYRKEFEDYIEIKPPTSFDEGLLKVLDWHHFKIYMTNKYIEILYYKMRDYIDVPISLLDPYPLLAAWKYFYDYIKEHGLDIHLWTEFWYSFYRSFDFKEDKLGHLFLKTGIYRYYIKKLKTPPLSIETQSSLAHTIEPDEAELLYSLLSVIGIPNINYYLFIGGENPRSYESHNGSTWDVYSPISLDGQERFHIKPIKALGKILRNNPKLSKAEFKPRIAFGIYEPYKSLNLWNYNELDESTNLNEYLIGERGLLTLLVMSNAAFDVIDLELSSLNELSHYEQLWVYSLDFMSREVQEKLARYVENGGNLVILPMLPYLDENLEECRVLEEYLGVKVEKVKAETNPRLIPFVSVDAEGIDRMITRNKIRRIEGGEHIAFVDGKPVGAIVRKGKGSAVVLGFRLQYFPSYHDYHRKFVEYIMKLQRVIRDVEVSNKDILTILMEGSEYSYLVIANPRGHRIKGKIKVKNKEIPKILDSIELKKRGVFFLPLNVKFKNVEVVYATGTILGIEKDMLTFYNHLSNKTEIALKGLNGVEVLNGKIIGKVEKEDTIIVAIEHRDDKVRIKLL